MPTPGVSQAVIQGDGSSDEGIQVVGPVMGVRE